MNSYIQGDEEASYLEDYLNTQPFISLKKVVFCFKSLSIEEVKLFMLDYKQVQSVTVNRKQRIIDMFENHTNDLKFLAMIGIDKEVPPGHSQAVQVLQEAGVKLCLATREDEESALATGYRLGLINDQLSIISISNFSNPAEALHEVRMALKEEVLSYAERQDNTDGRNYEEDFSELKTKRISERRNMQKGLMRRRSSLHPMLLTLGYGVEKGKDLLRLNSHFINFVVSIDGKTIDMAYKSHELLKNLVVLLFTAKAVFAHGLCPEQKRKFVSIFKENLQFKPCVLVIGQKNGNRKMINEGTVGVVVKENFEKGLHEADVFVRSFDVLPSLLLETGSDYLYGFRSVAVLTLIKEMMTNTALFLYQSQCGFSSCFWIEADNLVIFEYGISLVFIILIGLSSRQLNIFRDFRGYSSNFLYEKQVVIRMLVSSSYSIFLGVVLYFFALYGISEVVKKTGQTEDFQTSGLVAYILVNLVLFLHGFLISNEKFKAFLCVLFSLVLLTIHLAVISNQNSEYLPATSLTSISSFWFLITLFPFMTLLFSLPALSLYKSYFLRHTSRLSQYNLNIRRVFCDSSQLKFSKEDDDFELNNWTLTFKQYYRELIYRSKRFKTSLLYIRIFLVIVSLVSVISNIVVATGHQGFLNIGLYTAIVTIFQGCLAISSFLIDFTRLVPINLVSLVSFLVYSLIETFMNNIDSTSERYPVLLVMFTLLLYSTWKTTLIKSFLIFSLSILVVIYEASTHSNSDLALISTLWIILMFFLTLLTCIACYFQDKNRRNEYMFIQKVEIEVEKSANILSYLLPDFVRKRVKDGVRYIAEDKGTVSVVFCDICDFDKIVNLYSPQELTALIDEVFGRIDMICETLGITKIETVGKTYLACSGLKDSETGIDQNILRVSHARRAIEMGLEVLKDSTKTLLKDGSFLTFKIGINSGPVTAGVVGFHKPQFSLVGDTVNTASRMASTLTEENSIQISIATFEMLDDARGLIFKDCNREVKGKGFMETKIVQQVVLNIEEIVTDELNSMFNRRRSSVLNMHSTPTFVMNGGRSSDMTTPHQRHGRSSLLLNLDIRTPSELIVKHRTRRIYKFCYYLFRETEEEQLFRKDHEKMISGIQVLGIFSSAIANFLLIIAEALFIGLDLNHSSVFRLLILIICEISLFLGWKLTKILEKKLKIGYYLSSTYSVSFILLFIEMSLNSSPFVIVFIYLAYFYLLTNFFTGTFFKRNILFNLPLIGIWLSLTFQHDLQLPRMTLILVYTLAIQVMVFANEKKLMVNAALKSAAEKELEKTQQLLTQMMPPHALSNLEEGKEVTDRLSKVTLLYADIVGFTSWSSIRTPREVVGMLSELFTRFDRMCVENNVYKVHTIGDCYVAMGYINDKNRNPAREAVNVINFAQSLISLIEETNEKCKIQLGMRIGVHTGDIIAGITGTKIVRYDIYGADVLIANKMESNGEAGKIAVSESTKDIIESFVPGDFTFCEAKEVKISSLSKSIKMFFVTKDEKV
jgi:phospholipid-translocating ATPase